MAATNCKECTKPFAIGDNCIACEGFCSNAYHFECAKFTFDELLCYRKLRNVWYVCEECRIVMKEVRSSRSSTDMKKEMIPQPPNMCTKLDRVDREISALKEQIAGIHQTLVDVSFSHTSRPSSNVNTSVPLAQSTMFSAANLMCGTKSDDNPSCTVVEFGVPSEKYWLFFTKIKNSVTEREISEMITECLGTNDVVVRKLVPPWKDPSSMPYISFKVGVHRQFKETAQRSSTWPAGLCFREFRENVWEPRQRDRR